MRKLSFLLLLLIASAVMLPAQTSAQTSPIATLTLSSRVLTPNTSSLIEARIECGGVRCTAFQIELEYDPLLVRIDAVSLGGYLGEQALVANNQIDPQAGRLSLAATTLGISDSSLTADEPDNLLFTLVITGLAVGRTQFRATTFEIGDLQPLSASVRGGIVEITLATTTPAPTRTRTSTPTRTPRPTATEIVSCPGVLPSRLVVGEWGEVTPGDPNNLRDLPSTSGARVGRVPSGGLFEVLEGPVCNNGYAWWRINYGGAIGWTAEGDAHSYWLEPISRIGM